MDLEETKIIYLTTICTNRRINTCLEVEALSDFKRQRKTKIITDSSKKLIRRIESIKNSYDQKIIEATFDGKSRLIQKKTIGYDSSGRLSRVHDYDMLKPTENGDPILINIITYEYD